MYRILLLTALAGCCALLPGNLRAAESYDSCKGFINSLPATISTQGTWCLSKDLSTSMTSGAAILVATNNVTIDCNGFKLGGLAAGAGTQTLGILAPDRANITVRRCTVRGFYEGIQIFGAGSFGHVIEDNRFDGNTHYGMSIQGGGSVVRRNQVLDTGGSTISPIGVIAIWTVGNVDILDNTVDGALPLGDSGGNGWSWGIYASDNRSSIRDNRIRGVLAVGGGDAVGIQGGHAFLRDNDLRGPGGNGFGLVCSSSEGRAKDNMVRGFATSMLICGNAGGNDL